MERGFPEVEDIRALEWLRYIDGISFIWAESEIKLEGFLRLNTFHMNLKFTHEKSKTSVF